MLELKKFNDVIRSFKNVVFEGLTWREKTVLYKVSVEGLSFEEIANVSADTAYRFTVDSYDNEKSTFNIRPETVKSYFYTACKKVRENVKKNDLTLNELFFDYDSRYFENDKCEI